MAERVRASGRGWEGALVPLHTSTYGGKGKVDVAAMEVGRSLHGRHVQSRCHSLERFVEHVACDGVDQVEHVFRLPMGRIGPWAKNEVCQTRPALQL